MKTSFTRWIAIGALLALPFSFFSVGARADDATPAVASAEESATATETPEAVEISVGFYHCFDSETPGATDWVAFSDIEAASVSTCQIAFDAPVDPSQTISVYDANTDELLETIAFAYSDDESTETLAGSFYFVESENGTTSPVYSLVPGEEFSIIALVHIGTPAPSPSATTTFVDFSILATLCEPTVDSESGKFIVLPLRQTFNPANADVSTSAEEPTIACQSDTEDISSIGSYYLQTAGFTPSAESSYGPFTDSRVDLSDLPSGDYVIRLVRNTGVEQVSAPFSVTGEVNNWIDLFIYSGEVIVPTETATATATVPASVTAEPTSSTVTTLPNTGAGGSGSGTMLMALGALLVLMLGMAAGVARNARRG